jgi:hypothetical protein
MSNPTPASKHKTQTELRKTAKAECWPDARDQARPGAGARAFYGGDIPTLVGVEDERRMASVSTSARDPAAYGPDPQRDRGAPADAEASNQSTYRPPQIAEAAHRSPSTFSMPSRALSSAGARGARVRSSKAKRASHEATSARRFG